MKAALCVLCAAAHTSRRAKRSSLPPSHSDLHFVSHLAIHRFNSFPSRDFSLRRKSGKTQNYKKTFEKKNTQNNFNENKENSVIVRARSSEAHLLGYPDPAPHYFAHSPKTPESTWEQMNALYFAPSTFRLATTFSTMSSEGIREQLRRFLEPERLGLLLHNIMTEIASDEEFCFRWFFLGQAWPGEPPYSSTTHFFLFF